MGDALPVALALYTLSNKWKVSVQQDIDKLCQMGIIEPSYSPWAAPIVHVPKADGSIRICLDYRYLTAI